MHLKFFLDRMRLGFSVFFYLRLWINCRLELSLGSSSNASESSGPGVNRAEILVRYSPLLNFVPTLLLSFFFLFLCLISVLLF